MDCAARIAGQQDKLMAEWVVRLGLCVDAGSEAGAEELDKLVGQLLELDIESADQTTAGQARSRTRAGDGLELAGASRGDQRELIQAWIDRHTDR